MTAIVWDVSDTSVSHRHTLCGHTNALSYLSWCPTATQLLTCGKDHQIRLWDAEVGAHLHTLPTHLGEVQACVWFADGKRVVSTGLDKKMYVSSVDGGGVVRTWDNEFVIYDLAVGQEDKTIVGICSDRHIRIFSVEESECTRILEKDSVTSLAVSADR